MKLDIVTRTNLTCPECGFVDQLDIPLDYWIVFHTCASCGTRFRALPGDCCVICSFGDHHCIGKQREALQRDDS